MAIVEPLKSMMNHHLGVSEVIEVPPQIIIHFFRWDVPLYQAAILGFCPCSELESPLLARELWSKAESSQSSGLADHLQFVHLELSLLQGEGVLAHVVQHHRHRPS